MRKLIWSLVAIPLALGLMAAPAGATVRDPILPGGVHADGTWTYEDGHTESHAADYGVITSIGGGTLTVLRPDEQQVTVALPEDTCVRVDGMPATVGDLHPTMRAVVLSLRADDGSLSAMAVRAGAPLIRPYQPTCGVFQGAVHGEVTVTYRDGSTRSFTFDRGTVQSTAGGLIVVQHSDGGTVQATVDQDTRIFGAHSLGGLEGRQATMVAERIGDALIAKLVRAYND